MFALPSVFTLQKLLLLVAFTERSHQLQAWPSELALMNNYCGLPSRAFWYPAHRRLSLSRMPRRRDRAVFASVVQVWNVRSYSYLFLKKLLPSSTSS